ncbi:MAG: metal-dependent hydrolase [Magnetococcales bacterium]|nr:metal-dependent hydrolase [Magnetococcales bacterium]
MDIVTQGIIGAWAAQALAKPGEIRRATMIGLVAGLPADADIFIRSSTDPLLTLDFHRQFTHALVFIPIGALIVAGLLWVFFKSAIPFGQLYRYAFAGYATSGLLDAFTSYGTQLLWPFSDARISWSLISVVDPLFSLTLILLLWFGLRRHTAGFAKLGTLFIGGYFLVGLSQQAQAASVVVALAKERGHPIERMVVKPTMGNLLVWRTIYQSGGLYHITAVRVTPFGRSQYHAGEPLPLFRFDTDLDRWPKDSTLVSDVHRFKHFSNGYVALHPDNPRILGDVRYSLLPFDARPLWGITLRPDQPDQHVPFENDRSQIAEAMEIFPKLLTGSWEKWHDL